MTLLDEAVSRYHKLLATPEHRENGWLESLQEQMSARHLAPGGRPVCPVLRPHLITRRQYTSLVKASQTLYSAISRLNGLLQENAAMLSRMELFPAEKMLAGVDPGYAQLAVTTMLKTQVSNNSLLFAESYANGAALTAQSDALGEIFYDCAPVKQIRKKYKMSRPQGMKRLLHGLLTAYKGSGKKKFPRIAIVEFRAPMKGPGSDHLLLAEYLRQAGYPTEIVTPEQLEYRNGVLCRGDFGIEIVYRTISAQEFLVRFDLSHPLVRAYRENAVCVVNSFRTELLQKKAIFGLLTDETVTGKFPAEERRVIRDHLPWTRLVTAAKTTYHNKTIDLPEFISANREKLVLKPNDPSTDMHSYEGKETDEAAWDKALKTALRNPYVVQERVEPARCDFPVLQFGKMEIRPMSVDVYPHLFLGKMETCSTQVGDLSSTFSTLSGVAPTLILEGGK